MAECPKCKGFGRLKWGPTKILGFNWSIWLPAFKGDFGENKKDCPRCKGSGKVLVESLSQSEFNEQRRQEEKQQRKETEECLRKELEKKMNEEKNCLICKKPGGTLEKCYWCKRLYHYDCSDNGILCSRKCRDDRDFFDS